MRHAVPIFAFAALLAASGLAHAQDALIDKGIELRRAGKDAEALEVFERAFAETGSARALAQVALAHQALGHWVEAEQDLQDALQMGGPWIDENRAPLESAREKVRDRLGTLEVRGKPKGAEVVINGRKVGRLPLDGSVRVVAGDVVVQLSAKGHLALTRRVPVGPRKRVRETIQLVPQAEPLSVPPGQGGASRVAASSDPDSEGSAFFGAPSRAALILEAGYSSLPGVTSLSPANKWFAYGVKFGIDAGLFGSVGEDIPGTLTFYGGLPLILEMVDDSKWVARLSLVPGLGLTVIDYTGRVPFGELLSGTGVDLTGEYLALLVHASLDVGHRLNRWFTFGGGLDVPTTFFFGGGTDIGGPGVGGTQPEEFSVVPVLVGPTAEFRLSDQARIGLALRMGPHFTTGDLAENLDGEDLRTDFGFAARLAFAFAL
ncbi:MAG: PEGA domain-containing protein [Myxococcota bacterium]